MSAICKHLARGLDVRCGVRVGRIAASQSAAMVLDGHRRALGEFDFVVVTAPPVQTAALLAEASPKLAAHATAVDMKPCWAVMLAFDSKLDVPYDGAFINEGPLSWIARTSSKPARVSEPERWVLHASAAWSEAHLEEPAEQVTAMLLDAAFESMGIPAQAPIFRSAHRWRYALAGNPLDEGCLFDEAAQIGVCGDWTHGNRVEGAILSGRAMSRCIRDAARVV
jgi:predicted NAD/FAD-dependent oxidoreductase